MKIVLECLNIPLWILVMVYPWLIPAVSSQSALSAVIPKCMMIIIYGGLIGLDVSTDFCKLTEKQKKRRKLLLHYFPLWMIPTVILTLSLMIKLIEITLYN